MASTMTEAFSSKAAADPTAKRHRPIDRCLAVTYGILVAGAVIGCAPADQRATAGSDTPLGSTTQPHTALAAADTQRVAFSVKGMYCESCERTVAAMLRRTPGVLSADVSIERSEAIIAYDSARTSPAKLVDVIGSLGYVASVKRT